MFLLIYNILSGISSLTNGPAGNTIYSKLLIRSKGLNDRINLLQRNIVWINRQLSQYKFNDYSAENKCIKSL